MSDFAISSTVVGFIQSGVVTVLYKYVIFISTFALKAMSKNETPQSTSLLLWLAITRNKVVVSKKQMINGYSCFF